MRMRRGVLCVAALSLLMTTAVSAEVSMVERHSLKRSIHDAGKTPAKPVRATGSIALTDNSGFQYFLNTNITFATSSSASAAASEASYTHAVAATTLNGGTVSTTLNDAFDGYNTMCLSLDNTVAACQTSNANFVIYNQLGPATTELSGRQAVFPVQTSGALQIRRKVYVPTNDAFARWLNYFTNTGSSPLTVTMVISSNLGSDANTTIAGSSSGNTAAEVTDTWVTTFQNYSGTTSSDPRLGHIFQGPGAAVQLSGISFANGDDNPFWGYTFTLAPGETKIIMNFNVGQPSKAGAASKSTELVGLPANALQGLSQAELVQVANFITGPREPIVIPTLTETGLAAMAVGLALVAFTLILRRRSASAS